MARKKAAAKKAPTKPDAEGAPDGDPEATTSEGTAAEETAPKKPKAHPPMKAARSWRHNGRLYLRGEVYADIPGDLPEHFLGRFVPAKQDLD